MTACEWHYKNSKKTMNEFQLFINNEWTTFEVLNGDTYSWRADDTLDSGTVLFVSDDKMPIAPFTLAHVNFQGTEDVYMWACDDKVSVYTKGISPTYQHSVVLGELTKMLEKLEVQGFVSSDNGYNNLYQEVARFINNYNYIYGDKIQLYITYQSLIDELTATPPENFTMKSSTVREILDEMFSAINSRVEVTYCDLVDGKWRLYLNAFRLNKTINGTIADSDIVAVESQNSADNLAGRLVSEVENAMSPNAIRVVDTFKVKYGVANAGSDNRIMSLPYAIEYPINIYFRITGTVQINYWYKDSLGRTYPADHDFDFSDVLFDGLDHFVDKEYYETLNTADQEKRIFYERGSAEIDVSATYKKLLITKTYLASAMQDIITEYAVANWDTLKQQVTYSTTAFDPVATNNIDPDKIYYDLTYQARIDGLVMAFKNKDNRYGNQLAIYDNQSDSVIDIERYGGNLAGKIRRTGNDELYIDCNYQAYANILPLLTKTTIDGKDYVIYQVDFSRFYNGENYNYLVRYYLAEDYNNLNERIGIRRQKRIYEIPLTGYRTILPKIHTISISSSIKSGTKTDLAYEFVDTIGYPQSQRWRKRKIENAKVEILYERAQPQVTKTFTLPAIAYGAGQTVNVITKFYDNYSAGLSVTNTHSIIDWVGGKKVAYNPYVYNDGTAENFNVSYGSFETRSADGVQKQPAQPSSPETLDAVINDDFYYQKDGAESLTFQEIVNLKADGVILGNMLTAKNTLTVDNPPDLYVWTTATETYLQGDTKCKGTRGGSISVTEQNSFYEITALLPSGYKTAVALGDSDGNLYVAKNGNFSSTTNIYITEI